MNMNCIKFNIVDAKLKVCSMSMSNSAGSQRRKSGACMTWVWVIE
jgi:hypothetical protein